MAVIWFHDKPMLCWWLQLTTSQLHASPNFTTYWGWPSWGRKRILIWGWQQRVCWPSLRLQMQLQRRPSSSEIASERIWRTSPRQNWVLHINSIDCQLKLLGRPLTMLTLRRVPVFSIYFEHLLNISVSCRCVANPFPLTFKIHYFKNWNHFDFETWFATDN